MGPGQPPKQETFGSRESCTSRVHPRTNQGKENFRHLGLHFSGNNGSKAGRMFGFSSLVAGHSTPAAQVGE